jgi:hypothetical protein
MADAVGAAARGAIEAGERGEGRSRKPIQRVLGAWKGAGVKGVVWEHAVFHKGKAVGEGRPPYSPESCGAGIGGGSAVGRRA